MIKLQLCIYNGEIEGQRNRSDWEIGGYYGNGGGYGMSGEEGED